MARIRLDAGIQRILIGGSAGCFDQVQSLLENLKPRSTPPVVLLMHVGIGDHQDKLCEVINGMLELKCQTAQHSMALESGNVYVPKPGYHLLVDAGSNTLRLYDDEPYSYAIPSIDLLFSSCTGPQASHTLAILLSGANEDGAEGLAKLHAAGARCAAADPELCQFPMMPEAALRRIPTMPRLNPLKLEVVLS